MQYSLMRSFDKQNERRGEGTVGEGKRAQGTAGEGKRAHIVEGQCGSSVCIITIYVYS